MQTTLKVYRYDPETDRDPSYKKGHKEDPETDGQPRYQSYSLEMDEDATVLDALIQIREEQDGTLAFRGTCRSGFCGDCTMRINGKGAIACRATVAKAAKNAKDGAISVQPIKLVRIVKDFVSDMETFLYSRYKGVQPWLVPQEPLPDREHLVSNSVIQDLRKVMSCTMCGLCDSGCTVTVVDRSFMGPAALTKAYRFVADPRDTITRERTALVSQHTGVWDCTHCFEANSHCPKDIDPTDRIFTLRDQAIKYGFGPPQVVNHYKSFAASVKADGWLDEARLVVETEGFFNIKGLWKLLPTGLRAFWRGKRPLPYFLHRKRPGAGKIKRIFEKWEAKR